MPPRRSAAIPMIRATESFGRFFFDFVRKRRGGSARHTVPYAQGRENSEESDSRRRTDILPAFFAPVFCVRKSCIGIASGFHEKLKGVIRGIRQSFLSAHRNMPCQSENRLSGRPVAPYRPCLPSAATLRRTAAAAALHALAEIRRPMCPQPFRREGGNTALASGNYRSLCRPHTRPPENAVPHRDKRIISIARIACA